MKRMSQKLELGRFPFTVLRLTTRSYQPLSHPVTIMAHLQAVTLSNADIPTILFQRAGSCKRPAILTLHDVTRSNRGPIKASDPDAG